MALGVHFDNCGSIHDPFPGLLTYLGIDIEFVQEVLDVTLFLDVQKAGLEFISEGQLLVAVSLAWWISDSSAVL